MSEAKLIVGETLRDLIEPLAERLGEPLDDPFAGEQVVVPNLGVRQWTTRALARRLGTDTRGGTVQGDGIVANIEFPFPDGMLTRLLGAPDHDPWALSNLVWVVLEELQAGAGDQALGPAGRAAPGTRRSDGAAEPSTGTWYGRARHLADLFDRYSRHRPELIRQWAQGNDVDGRGKPLPRNPPEGGAQRWQCELWRRVRRRIGEPSPAERLSDQLADLTAHLDEAHLPERLTLFGLSALPPVWFPLLSALERRCDVGVLWLTPSMSQWTDRHARGRTQHLGPWLPERAKPTAVDGGNNLLGRWSRPAQEAARLWGAGTAWNPTPARSGSHDDSPSATVLARLQAAIAGDRPTPVVLTERDGGLDHSLVVHRAHGPSRQVEVLRTAIAHALLDDPSLGLDDVLVLCPDLDTYGSLVAAAFAPGAGDPTATDTSRSTAATADDGHGHGDGLAAFPVWSAVRSPGTDHPIARTLLGILNLVDGRATVGEVLNLLMLEPVAVRFGLDQDAEEVGAWARRAGVRWGLDGPHRATHGLPSEFSAATWSAGLDRLLLGVSTTAEELASGIGQVVPIDVEGGDVGLVARLAAAVAQLRELIGRVRPGHLGDPAAGDRLPLSSWIDWVLGALNAMTEVSSGDDWQRHHLIEVLDELRPRPATEATAVTADPLLTVGEFRAAVTESLSAVRRRGGPAEGAVTLGPLPALRSVPARVICLLGVDADILGSGTADADDLLAAAPALGDRDPRADGRQLLLEAILAAEDRLIITTTGRDPATNAEVPLPVVLAELLEELAPAGPGADDPPGGSALVNHPRHDFDAANFEPGRLGTEAPWSFSPVGLAEAITRGGPTTSRATAPFLDAPLTPVVAPGDGAGTIIELADLHRFLAGAPSAFLVQRLGVVLPREEELGDDLHPVEVDPLHRYQLHSALLDAAARVGDLDAAFERWGDVARSSGELPPGELAEEALSGMQEFTRLILNECERVGIDRPGDASVPVEVSLPGGWMIRGTVPEVDPTLPGPVRIGAQRLKPKHELALWLDLLMLAADDPATAWRGVHVGRGKDKTVKGVRGPAATSMLPVIVGDDPDARHAAATAALQTVVGLYVRNLSEPLPLWPNTAAKLCDRSKLTVDSWRTTYPGGGRSGDGNEAATLEIWGDLTEQEYELLPARDDDPGDPNEQRRALRLATELWQALDASVTGSPNAHARSGSGS
ncbi:MAG: exodeoxyribonuclease V subunit gamma [Microthrixaceae bacterium]|nr:exodeoxyribonuclease V subunit gamma [Microthrixaceae bacterium]